MSAAFGRETSAALRTQSPLKLRLFVSEIETPRLAAARLSGPPVRRTAGSGTGRAASGIARSTAWPTRAVEVTQVKAKRMALRRRFIGILRDWFENVLISRFGSEFIRRLCAVQEMFGSFTASPRGRRARRRPGSNKSSGSSFCGSGTLPGRTIPRSPTPPRRCER